MAPQINLGCLEFYRVSGRLVIALLQGCIRVMSFFKKKKKMVFTKWVIDCNFALSICWSVLYLRGFIYCSTSSLRDHFALC